MHVLQHAFQHSSGPHFSKRLPVLTVLRLALTFLEVVDFPQCS
jgi:hypothetical protein